MARYYNGHRIDPEPGFKQIDVYGTAVSPVPTDLKINQSFCLLKSLGNQIELKGAVTLSSSNRDRGIVFGMLKLPDNYSGKYVLDRSKGKITGNIDRGTTPDAVSHSAAIENNVLTLSSLFTDGQRSYVLYGAFVFDLFFTKQ